MSETEPEKIDVPPIAPEGFDEFETFHTPKQLAPDTSAQLKPGEEVETGQIVPDLVPDKPQPEVIAPAETVVEAYPVAQEELSEEYLDSLSPEELKDLYTVLSNRLHEETVGKPSQHTRALHDLQRVRSRLPALTQSS